MTETSPNPAEPAALGQAGKALWHSVVDRWQLDPDEAELVAQACAVADEVLRMRIELARAKLVTTGSTGQPAAHPLVGEIRSSREQMRRLLSVLRRPALQDEVSGSTISDAARNAAAARWVRRHGA